MGVLLMGLIPAIMVGLALGYAICPGSIYYKIFSGLVSAIIFLLLMLYAVTAEPQEMASWYSVESCRREGTCGIMANGKELDDEENTCASWDYSFGTMLRITNVQNKKSVRTVVTDRGPAKALYDRGRKIDLSRKAFSSIADLSQGVIPIQIEMVE